MAKAFVAIVGDAASYLRAVRQSVTASNTLGVAFKDLGIDAKASADVQIQAALKRDAALRQNVAALRASAAAAPANSREQIVATNLASSAELRLARSHGVTAAEAEKLSRSSRTAERDVGKATRGLLAGSGAAEGLGRSLAFASGGYLAFAGGADILRKSVDAARELARTQRQDATQLKAAGESWKEYRGEIDKTTLKLSGISGFTRQDLLGSFGLLVRSTGDATQALRLNAVAADVARGRNISLQTAAIALGKAWLGDTASLKRLGVEVPKGVSGLAAINVVAAKFKGQARAGASEADRFNATLTDSEEIIGQGLLPVLNHYLGDLANWLQKMNDSGRLQRDVNTAVRDARDIFKTFGGIVQRVDRLTGGFKHTLEILAAFKFVSMISKWRGAISTLIGSKGSTGLLGAESASAGLYRNLAALAAKPFLVALVLDILPASGKGQKLLDKNHLGFLGRLPLVGKVGQYGALAGNAASLFLDNLAYQATGVPGPEQIAAMKRAEAARRYRLTHPKPQKPVEMILSYQEWVKLHPDATTFGEAEAHKVYEQYRRRRERSYREAVAAYKITKEIYDRRTGQETVAEKRQEREERQRRERAAAQRAARAAKVLGTTTGNPQLARVGLEVERAAATGNETRIIRVAREVVGQLQKLTPDLKGKDLASALRLEARERKVISEAEKKNAEAAAKVARQQAEAARKQQEAARKQEEAAAKLGQAAQSAVQAAQQQIGQLFQGPVLNPSQEQTLAMLGAGPTAAKLIQDVAAQNKQFREFIHGIRTLKREHIPAAALRELESQGVSALPEIQALLKASPSQRRELIRLLRQRDKEIVQAAVVNMRTPKVSMLAQRVLIATGHSAAVHGGHDQGDTHVHVHVDGREVARATAPHHARHKRRHINSRGGRYGGN